MASKSRRGAQRRSSPWTPWEHEISGQPPWCQKAGWALRIPWLSLGAFGGLQGVNLHHLLALPLQVSGEITQAVSPFGFGLGAGLAVNAMGCRHRSGATLAGLNDRIAVAAIKGTAFPAHEKTLRTLFDRLTEHRLSLLVLDELLDPQITGVGALWGQPRTKLGLISKRAQYFQPKKSSNISLIPT